MQDPPGRTAPSLGKGSDRGVHPVGEPAVPFLMQRDEQRFLTVEVQVRGAFGHPGLGGDIGHGGGVIPGPGEAGQRGGDDLVPPRRPPLLSDLGHAGPPVPVPGARSAPPPRIPGHSRRPGSSRTPVSPRSTGTTTGRPPAPARRRSRAPRPPSSPAR